MPLVPLFRNYRHPQMFGYIPNCFGDICNSITDISNAFIDIHISFREIHNSFEAFCNSAKYIYLKFHCGYLYLPLVAVGVYLPTPGQIRARHLLRAAVIAFVKTIMLPCSGAYPGFSEGGGGGGARSTKQAKQTRDRDKTAPMRPSGLNV